MTLFFFFVSLMARTGLVALMRVGGATRQDDSLVSFSPFGSSPPSRESSCVLLLVVGRARRAIIDKGDDAAAMMLVVGWSPHCRQPQPPPRAPLPSPVATKKH